VTVLTANFIACGVWFSTVHYFFWSVSVERVCVCTTTHQQHLSTVINTSSTPQHSHQHINGTSAQSSNHIKHLSTVINTPTTPQHSHQHINGTSAHINSTSAQSLNNTNNPSAQSSTHQQGLSTVINTSTHLSTVIKPHQQHLSAMQHCLSTVINTSTALSTSHINSTSIVCAMYRVRGAENKTGTISKVRANDKFPYRYHLPTAESCSN
jgi:hypothetical protein